MVDQTLDGLFDGGGQPGGLGIEGIAVRNGYGPARLNPSHRQSTRSNQFLVARRSGVVPVHRDRIGTNEEGDRRLLAIPDLEIYAVNSD